MKLIMFNAQQYQVYNEQKPLNCSPKKFACSEPSVA